MPKGQDDYLDKNLSKLYELEGRRQKMSDLAEEKIKKGEPLSSPELLKESNTFSQLILDEELLADLASQLDLENEERQPLTQEQKDDKTNTAGNTAKNKGKDEEKQPKEGEQPD